MRDSCPLENIEVFTPPIRLKVKAVGIYNSYAYWDFKGDYIGVTCVHNGTFLKCAGVEAFIKNGYSLIKF